MLKKAFHFFIFSSLYIAICSIIMVYQVSLLFPSVVIPATFYFFVFFSTVCSYNFHWWLSGYEPAAGGRLNWAFRYKKLHFALYVLGLAGAITGFFLLKAYWFWIGIGVFFTFLYSAPKLPGKLFLFLRRIAVGKTIFLAVVWTYITSILPVLISGHLWQKDFGWFAAGRFFLIYAICILFDFRDRETDKASGIRSLITWFDEKGINRIFVFSLIVFALFTVLLSSAWPVKLVLLIPGLAVALLYRRAKSDFSDYLYYFVLDGLMMLSGLLMILLRM